MTYRMPLALAVAFFGAAAAPQAKDDREDLIRAVEKTAALENYRFRGSVEILGLPTAGPFRISGEHVLDAGLRYRLDPLVEIYHVGTQVVMAEAARSDWVLLKPGHRFGESPAGVQLAVLVRGLRPPHEELARLHERFGGVWKRPATEKIGDKDCAVLEGPLSPSGATDFLLPGLSRMTDGRAIEGKASVWVGTDERIARVQAECRFSATARGRAVEVRVLAVVEFYDAGKAALTIPEEVRRLLEGPSDEKKAEESR